MKRTKVKAEEFEKMMQEATVDCYTDDEAFMGVVCALQDKLRFPFEARVLGRNVTVIDIDDGKSAPGAGVLAKVIADGKKHLVSLSTMRLLDKTSAKGKRNAKWIAMYEWWAKGG